MPELPEVEAIARTLRPLIVGRRIERCEVIHPIAVERASRVSKDSAARLNPCRAANRLTAAECQRLHNSIVEVLRRALKCCLHLAPDIREPEWWFAGLERILRVYGREGESRARCGGKIRQFEQGGRSTFACLRCQK